MTTTASERILEGLSTARRHINAGEFDEALQRLVLLERYVRRRTNKAAPHRRRQKPREYRLTAHIAAEEVFGVGPWPCAHCGKPVPRLGGPNNGRRGVVHHKDHNQDNNTSKNIQIMHSACHTSLHQRGREKGKQERQRISAGKRRS